MNQQDYKKLLPILQEAVDNGMLSDRDEKFASSLLDFHEKRGFLSPNQAKYIPDMIARAQGTRSEKVATAPRESTGEVVDAIALQTLFNVALKNKVAYPAITYQYDDIPVIRAFLADNGRDIVFIAHESRVRYGWHSAAEGTYQVSSSAPIGSEIYGRIRAIIANPVEEAVFSGKKWNSCMFCGKTLNNNFSVQHGYGPICAANYGLPWNAAGGSAKAGIEDFIGLDDGWDYNHNEPRKPK